MMKSTINCTLVVAVTIVTACELDRNPRYGPAPFAASTAGTSPGLVDASQTTVEESIVGGAQGDRIASPDPRVDANGVDASIILDTGEPTTDANIDRPDSSTDTTMGFGLSCQNIICPSVTLPSQQCCTEESDVLERLARDANLCGVARSGISGCFELEQLGVLDDNCPSVKPTDTSAEEPGCCTVDGRCGTFNVADGIGCHENRAIDQPCGEEVIDEESVCEPTGIYAVRAEVEVVWGGQTGLLFDISDDGRGLCVIDLKLIIDSVDANNAFVGRVEPCGVDMPPIVSSLLCEAYKPTFPDEIWDSDNMPVFSMEGSFTCLHPGCVLSAEPTSAMLGIELEDVDAVWPTVEEATNVKCPSGTGRSCYPDHDGDGYPGLTITLPDGEIPGYGMCPRGYTLQAAPLNANIGAILGGVVRTDRVHLGARIRLGASGQLAEDCSITDAVGVAEFVQSRATGCRLQPGSRNLFELPAGSNDRCNQDELLFMDRNLPIYDILRLGDIPDSELDLEDRSPSDGPRFQMVRVGDLGRDVSCQDIRATFN